MRFLTLISLPIAGLLLALLTQVGCEQSPAPQAETLIIGVTADYPPFEFKHQGNLVGFDIDLGQALAEQMGRHIEFKDMDFQALIPALQSGHIDLALSGMTPTPSRREHVAFSDLYFTIREALVFREGDHYAELPALAGKTVGVQMGTTMEMHLQQYPQLNILSLTANPMLIEALKSGRIDAFLCEQAQAEAFSKQLRNLAWQPIAGHDEGYAVALKQQSPLLPAINSALATLQADGSLAQLRATWLGNQGDQRDTK